jgi:pimeloyl-ACP methyl ester carboxylesterase
VLLSARIRGEGLPIVLLPGFGLNSAVMSAAFEPVFAAISGWRRIYLDLPGTGGSAPVDPHSDAVLDAVQETVESMISPAPFLLAGWSYGGYLTAGLVRRMPTQILGLLLVCAGGRIDPDERNLSRVLPSVPEPDWLAEVPDELRAHFSHAIGCQSRSVANRVARAFELNGPNADDYLDVLRSTGYQLSDESSPHHFDGNVMLLAGRQDRIAGRLDQFDALKHYGHGSFVALADAGHYLPFEQPERFMSSTLDWLAQHGSIHQREAGAPGSVSIPSE